MKLKLTSSLFWAILLSGCNSGRFPEPEQVRTIEVYDHYCTADSESKRADFSLKCIKNANPMSDEEPEDWIWECHRMSVSTFCPKITLVKMQRYDGNFWRDISQSPKKTTNDL